MITQDEVRELFEYDAETGRLIRKISTARCTNIGDIVGRDDGNGYLAVGIKYKLYRIHRLVWLHHHGWLPDTLDHIDHDTFNNKIENLRPCSRSENKRNGNSHKGSSSRYKGVCWHKCHKKWGANIRLDKLKHLGYFITETEAALAYNEAATKYFGEFARLNIIKETV